MDHWDHLLKNLDRTMAEINEIDKKHDYKVLSIVLREDVNRGYSLENLEKWI